MRERLSVRFAIAMAPRSLASMPVMLPLASASNVLSLLRRPRASREVVGAHRFRGAHEGAC